MACDLSPVTYSGKPVALWVECSLLGKYKPGVRLQNKIYFAEMEKIIPCHRHPVLAQNKTVLYAGEASFNNGKLDWWSNGSGNYRPDSDHAEQAALPMERFFTYEQVGKGHKQPRQQIAST